MVLTTLRAMALGGMRDHLGGGFHRYSVDGDWRVPHFEKMLYDQAQLVLAYLEAAQLTGDAFYADVAADTLDYVRRDLTDAEGGFFSAEDADSVPPEQAADPAPHKSEGAFYIWRDDEIGERARRRRRRLPPALRRAAGRQRAVRSAAGVHAQEPALHGAADRGGRVAHAGGRVEEVEAALERARRTLLAVRDARPRPHLDDKVLTAWNGLMIAALRPRRARARGRRRVPGRGAARRVVHPRAPVERAPRARCCGATGRGDAGVEGYAEDYAYLIFGLLELFQADGDPGWLEWALTLQRRQDELFWDPVDGGWFSTTGRDPSVLLRLKEDYDGAEPAASSVAVLNLLTLSHLTGGPRDGGEDRADARRIRGRAPHRWAAPCR